MPDATDSAQKRADELGVDIDKVQGSGQDGRVLVSDVEAAAGDEPQSSYVVKLNPDSNLGGYQFDSDFGVLPGVSYLINQQQYDKYKSVKHKGVKVLAKV